MKVSKATTLNLLMCISFIHGMAWHIAAMHIKRPAMTTTSKARTKISTMVRHSIKFLQCKLS
jgi:hypothetical protein